MSTTSRSPSSNFAKGAILTSFVMTFIDILKELPATMILAPLNFETLAISVYNLASDERLVESAPSALVILLSGTIPLIFYGCLGLTSRGTI